MEDIKLWEEYEKTKSSKIREDIINKYAPLVKIVAGRLNIYTNNVIEFDDLVGYGIFGLLDAIEKYDYKKGFKFETYASLRIRGEIIDNIRKLDWVPRTLRQKNKALENAQNQFESENGREPTEEEIAQMLDISIEETKILRKQSATYNLISLDDYLENNHDNLIKNTHTGEMDTPEKVFDNKEMKKHLIELLNELTEKQKTVIKLYYYEELTLKEISKIMNVSESRVSQIHSKVTKSLKKKLGGIINL